MKKRLLLTLVILMVFSTLGFPKEITAEEPTPTPTPSIIMSTASSISETIEPTLTSSPELEIYETFEPTKEIEISTPEILTEETKGPGFELSPNIPNTQEARDIISTLEKAYDIEVEAAFTFDFSKFPTVFINDPRFPVSPDTLETIKQLTLNNSLESAGWLDYKIAYNTWVKESILHYELVSERAKAENRELTEEERNSLTDPWGRSAPARSQSPNRKIPITYLTLEVIDDIAVVTLYRGIYYSQLTLVLVDKQWYVASEYFLSVSP